MTPIIVANWRDVLQRPAGTASLTDPRRPNLAALAAMIIIAALHTVLVWGYTPVFWGDVGVQLHHIERVAGGELPYRDFYLTSPPLGLWIVGSAARVAGTDLGSIWIVTTLIFVGIVAAAWWYLDALMPRGHRLLGGAAAIVLALSYAQVGGAALPLGSYYVSATVGFLALVLAAGFLIRSLGASIVPVRTEGARRGWVVLDGGPVASDRLGRGSALAIGILCGLCVIAKQDFWAPALLLAIVAVGFCWTRADRLGIAAVIGGCTVTVLSGIGIIAATAGWETVTKVITGYGMASEMGLARGLPSWERLTVEVFAASLLGAGVAAALASSAGNAKKARGVAVVLCGVAVLAASLYLLMGMRTGFRVRADGLDNWPTALESAAVWGTTTLGLVRIVVGHLHEAWTRHFFPTLLPIAAAVIVLIRREELTRSRLLSLLGLLGFCIAARFRRGFEWVEWFHFLLELPVYALMLHWVFGDRGDRALRILMPALLVLGVYFHWTLGMGPLTQRGIWPPVQTLRGTVHWYPNEAADFKKIGGALHALDPSGTRPVVSFGWNGGFAYFLDRPNPTPLSYGFTTSTVPPEEAVRLIRTMEPAPFLIYTRAYERAGVPVLELDFGRWAQRLRGNVYATHDVPYFRQATAGCKEVGLPGDPQRPFFVIYDCAQALDGGE